MENIQQRNNIVKWAGLLLVLGGIATRRIDKLGDTYVLLAIAGFALLALFQGLNLKTYLKATQESGARKKGPIVYFTTMMALFAVFAVLCLRRLIQDTL